MFDEFDARPNKPIGAKTTRDYGTRCELPACDVTSDDVVVTGVGVGFVAGNVSTLRDISPFEGKLNHKGLGNGNSSLKKMLKNYDISKFL